MALFENLLDIAEIGRDGRVRVCRSSITSGGDGRFGFIIVGIGGSVEMEERRVCEGIHFGSGSELEKESHGGRLRFQIRV